MSAAPTTDTMTLVNTSFGRGKLESVRCVAQPCTRMPPCPSPPPRSPEDHVAKVHLPFGVAYLQAGTWSRVDAVAGVAAVVDHFFLVPTPHPAAAAVAPATVPAPAAAASSSLGTWLAGGALVALVAVGAAVFLRQRQ